ncbi:MAG: lactoylglutathione lyase [Flavobacteriales bacterium]|nr:lactoylglutathione lyase [Flavobacteriales bacterium]
MEVEFILYVGDLAKSRDLYAALLDRAPALDVPGMVEFHLDGCKLGLMPNRGIARIIAPPLPDPASGNGVPRCELYLLMEDAEAILHRAERIGLDPVSAFQDRDWGHRVAYYADPDGHVIAVASPVTSFGTSP